MPAPMPDQDHALPVNQLLEPRASSVPLKSSPESSASGAAPASTEKQVGQE